MPKSQSMRILYLVLLLIAGLLVLILITGTIFALVRSPDTDALFKLGKDRESPSILTYPQNSDIRIFTGLGQLRIPLYNSSVLILSITFPFQADDIAFTEELAMRIGDFKNLASVYFMSLNEENLTFFNEEEAKKDLLRLYNNNLRLGRIEALYFSEFMIIDAIN